MVPTDGDDRDVVPSRLSLFDLPALAPVAATAAQFGLQISVFGGTASRAAIAHLRGRSPDLLALVPNVSDVDVVHNGPAYLNPVLRAAIQEEVPFAQWVRWSVLDREAADKTLKALPFNSKIPLRSIAVSTAASELSPHFLQDAQRGRASFSANEAFTKSPLYREDRDLEVFSVLIYLAARLDLMEFGGSGPLRDAPISATDPEGFQALREVVGRARARDAERLLRAPLESRLWYLVSALAGRTPSWALEMELGALGMLEVLPPTVLAPFRRTSVAVTSSRLGRGNYRLPTTTSLKRGTWFELLARTDLDRAVELDPVYRYFASTEWMEVRQGAAPSSPRAEAEFVTLSWEETAKEPPPEDLGAFLILRDLQGVTSIAHVASVAGASTPPGRSWLRLDLAPALARQAAAVMAVIVRAASDAEYQAAERDA